MSPEPILVDRVRNIRHCTFGWIDHNLLHDGFIHRLSPESLLLYFFLCLVGDRNGCSYYTYERICSLLDLSMDQFVGAWKQLSAQSLIAFEHPIFQVLSLPERKKIKPVSFGKLTGKENRKSEQAIQSLQDVFQQLGAWFKND